jgi:hypothetical protein
MTMRRSGLRGDLDGVAAGVVEDGILPFVVWHLGITEQVYEIEYLRRSAALLTGLTQGLQRLHGTRHDKRRVGHACFHDRFLQGASDAGSLLAVTPHESRSLSHEPGFGGHRYDTTRRRNVTDGPK